jgi:isochorismate hydrolase
LQLTEAALLVLDMQEYFLNPESHAFIPSAEAILPNLQALIAAFRRHARPVIFTRHLNTPADAGAMSRWWSELIRRENPLSALTPRLDPAGDRVLLKTQYDAFLHTGLEAELRQQGVTQVVITGVMTHLCCETTARAAFTRGFDVFFMADATATYNAAFHRAALLTLSHGFAVPLLTPQVLANAN